MHFRKKRFLQKILVNDVSWFLLKPFIFLSKRAIASRSNFLFRKEETECINICKRIFKDEEVLHGLFSGMKMRGIVSTGSNLYAKLLGCYEEVVMNELTLMLAKNYENLINIGSDEGAYAVGIALKFPNMNIFTFDCNKKAQAQCLKLVQLNNVKNKFVINGCFDFSKIAGIDDKKKTLFLVDCEGCENEIFTREMLTSFTNADYIIELHYERYPLLLEKMRSIFSETHDIKLLTAKSDFEIIKENDFVELDGLSFEQKKYILSERPSFAQWLIAKAKA